MTSPSADEAPLCIQSLPIRTPFYGTTDVERNFSSLTTRDENGTYHNTLRGRQLLGKEVTMPQEYCVAVAEFTSLPESECQSASGRPSAGAAGGVVPPLSPTPECVSGAVQAAEVRISTCRPSYLVWEHDQLPTSVDALQQWLALAAVLHS